MVNLILFLLAAVFDSSVIYLLLRWIFKITHKTAENRQRKLVKALVYIANMLDREKKKLRFSAEQENIET